MTVAQESLHGGQVHAGLDQVCGESVTQAVDAAFGGDAGGISRGAVDALRCVDIDRRAAFSAATNLPRKTLESALTGNRNPRLAATH